MKPEVPFALSKTSRLNDILASLHFLPLYFKKQQQQQQSKLIIFISGDNNNNSNRSDVNK